MKKVTIGDVAGLAGVTTGTVSALINVESVEPLPLERVVLDAELVVRQSTKSL